MRLQYGGYTHPIGEAAVAITKEAVYSDAGQAYAVRERWDVTGLIVGANAGAVDSAAAALEAAYAADGLDVSLLLYTGAESHHKITSDDTIGGTKIVKRPHFPQAGGAEGVTYRHYAMSIEALVPIVLDQVILSFGEVLSFSGGGPRIGYIETLTGPPVQQLLRNYTVCRATQQGQAVGLYGYPIVPGPLWPSYQVKTADVVRRSPRRRGAGYFEYEVSWSYEFEAPARLAGSPHVWTA